MTLTNGLIYLIVFISVLGIVQVCLEYRLKHIDKDARTRRQKCLRKVLLGLNILAILAAVTCAVLKEMKADKSGKASASILNGVRSDVTDLTSAIRTNPSVPPSTRLALINAAEKQAANQQETVKTELSRSGGVNLDLLRKERQANDAMLELGRQRAEILRTQIETTNKEIRAQDIRRQLENGKRLDEDCAVLFDYAVRRLYEMLSDLSNQTGNKLVHNFPNRPTVYFPPIISDNGFQPGKYFVSLGTNEGWRFDITIEWNPAMLRIRGHEVNTLLNVYPLAVSTNGNVSEFQVVVNIQDEDQLFSAPFCSPNNCPDIIDGALRTLLESQDRRYPLTPVQQTSGNGHVEP